MERRPKDKGNQKEGGGREEARATHQAFVWGLHDLPAELAAAERACAPEQVARDAIAAAPAAGKVRQQAAQGGGHRAWAMRGSWRRGLTSSRKSVHTRDSDAAASAC